MSSNVQTPTENMSQRDEESSEVPIVEGQLVQYLRDSLDRTVGKCIARQTVQYLFQKNYPLLAEKRKKSLDGIHKEYVHKLQLTIKEEIANMFEEEKICELLNELEELQQAAPKEAGYVAWRPSGVPADDMRCHLMAIKEKQKAKLEEVLRDEEEKGERLHKVLVARRRQLAKLKARCEGRTEQVTQVTSELPKKDIEDFLKLLHSKNNNVDGFKNVFM